MAQGEYVAPANLELLYLQSKFVNQIYIHANSLKAYLVAVVVPHKEYIQSRLESINNNNAGKSQTEIYNHPLITREILRDLARIGHQAQVSPYSVGFVVAVLAV